MKIVVGLPVSGIDFFGYSELLKQIWATLENSSDIILYGPRRSGKTSLLRRIAIGAQERDITAIYLDLESTNGPEEFVSLLYREVKKLPGAEGVLSSAMRKLSDGIRGIKKAEVSVTGLKLEFTSDTDGKWDWKSVGDVLIESLVRTKKPTVWLLDEFAYFILNLPLEQLDEFLMWFRRVRHDPTSSLKVRWLVTSEVQIYDHLRSLNTRYVFEDFISLTIPPLDEEEASDILYSLSASIGIEIQPEQRHYAIARLGQPYPFDLQLFIYALSNTLGRASVVHENTQIDQTFHYLLDTRNHLIFPLSLEIIYSQFGEQLATLFDKIVNFIAVSERSISRLDIQLWLQSQTQGNGFDEEQIQRVLDILVHDYILLEDQTGLQLRSKLFRDSLRQRA